jgi:hypothetical protein
MADCDITFSIAVQVVHLDQDGNEIAPPTILQPGESMPEIIPYPVWVWKLEEAVHDLRNARSLP